MRMMPPGHREKIIAMYQNEDCSQVDVGRRLGVHQSTVSKVLREAGVPTDSHRKARKLNDEDRRAVVQMYQDGASNKEITERFGITPWMIYSSLRALGVPRRSPHTSRVGKKCAPGDTGPMHGGYISEKVPDDWPFLGQMRGAGDGTWVAQHRKVMAEHLGRALLREEQVHHKDGNRTNNDLSNLQIRVGGHGSGVSFCCADCGSERLKPVEIGSVV